MFVRTTVRLLAGTGLFLLLAALPHALAAGPEVSRDEAVGISTEALLGGSLEGVRLYIHPDVLPAGTVISTWKKDVFVMPADGWFVFIDRMPAANWEHPCWYIFVDARTGDVRHYDAAVPPRLQGDLVEITNGRDNPPPGESEKAHAWLDRRLREVPKPAPADRGLAYAFIISGGASQGNNHIRYWNDSSFIYKCLVNYYGYADEQIYVCISDGTNPAPDRSDGTNSPPDLDGDGDPDIQYPATRQYIGQVFNELATILNPSDQLFIFTTDHGGQESGWDCYLNLWNWEELADHELAAYVDALPCETVICTFEQCYSGGMIDDLQGDGRVISTAARWDQVSWAMGPHYIYDAYVYYWTCAVAWEDPYGNPVDADTNDDGLVSMREAFLYAEAHDQENEDPQYSSTPEDLGDLLTLFGNLQGVYLALDDIGIDDDMLGASHGDGDGVIEFNETIELSVTLHNLGLEPAQDVSGTLRSVSEHVTWIRQTAAFGDIPSEGYGTSAPPFLFHVTHDVANEEDLGLTLELNADPGTMAIGQRALAPAYLVGILDIDDSGGNGNGVPDPGETVVLTLWIENDGGCDTPEIDATLGTGCAYFIPDETPHPLGVIPVGQGVTEGGFIVTVAPECPEMYTDYLRLHVWGPEQYQKMTALSFSVGEIFADDMEGGGAAWTHYAGQGTWLDQWHLETYRNHTPAGQTSWKCGGAGAAQYGNLLYSILETTPFELPPESRLTFWHWCEAETSNAYAGYCYDGGRLEISTNGGASWSPLTPEGGYPFRVRAGGTPGPFPAETPVWSGRHGWREVSVDLTGYAGAAGLRWSFGSDGATAREGWYVDDVRIYTRAVSGAPGDPMAEALRPRMLPVSPNPVALGEAFNPDGVSGAGLVQFRFTLPAAAGARLELYDATGRLVRTLLDRRVEGGAYAVAWDGRDAAGHGVPAGSYYYRLLAGGHRAGGRLAVIR